MDGTQTMVTVFSRSTDSLLDEYIPVEMKKTTLRDSTTSQHKDRSGWPFTNDFYSSKDGLDEKRQVRIQTADNDFFSNRNTDATQLDAPPRRARLLPLGGVPPPARHRRKSIFHQHVKKTRKDLSVAEQVKKFLAHPILLSGSVSPVSIARRRSNSAQGYEILTTASGAQQPKTGPRPFMLIHDSDEEDEDKSKKSEILGSFEEVFAQRANEKKLTRALETVVEEMMSSSNKKNKEYHSLYRSMAKKHKVLEEVDDVQDVYERYQPPVEPSDNEEIDDTANVEIHEQPPKEFISLPSRLQQLSAFQPLKNLPKRETRKKLRKAVEKSAKIRQETEIGMQNEGVNIDAEGQEDLEEEDYNPLRYELQPDTYIPGKLPEEVKVKNEPLKFTTFEIAALIENFEKLTSATDKERMMESVQKFLEEHSQETGLESIYVPKSESTEHDTTEENDNSASQAQTIKSRKKDGEPSMPTETELLELFVAYQNTRSKDLTYKTSDVNMTSLIRYLKGQDGYQRRLEEYNRKQFLVQKRHDEVMRGAQRVNMLTSAYAIGDTSRRRNDQQVPQTRTRQQNESKQLQNRVSTPYNDRDESKGTNRVVQEGRERNNQVFRSARKIGACLRLGHIGFQKDLFAKKNSEFKKARHKTTQIRKATDEIILHQRLRNVDYLPPPIQDTVQEELQGKTKKVFADVELPAPAPVKISYDKKKDEDFAFTKSFSKPIKKKKIIRLADKQKEEAQKEVPAVDGITEPVPTEEPPKVEVPKDEPQLPTKVEPQASLPTVKAATKLPATGLSKPKPMALGKKRDLRLGALKPKPKKVENEANMVLVDKREDKGLDRLTKSTQAQQAKVVRVRRPENGKIIDDEHNYYDY